MASSSVSQESLEPEEYDVAAARRSRVKGLRVRGGPGRVAEDSPEVPATTGAPDDTTGEGVEGVDQDSPSRAGAKALAKDKRRPNHLHKGKTAKDKRKLREKRRSTGVVHLPSESTGDSLDDDEDKVHGETKRNTSYNEVIDADNPQTPEEVRATKLHGRNIRNKSPSDLEADLEDNQDYDSTVSHSETNLTTLGQCSPSPLPTAHSRLPGRSSPEGVTRRSPLSSQREDHHARPVSYPSRFHEQDADLENIQYAANLGTKMGLSRLHRRDPNGQAIRKTVNATARSSSLESSESKILTRNRELEKLLDIERDSNRQMRSEKLELERLLEERAWKITQLEREIHLMHRQLEQKQ